MSGKKRLCCIVGSETVRMLNLGHPWVIADRYTSRWPQAACGSLIELKSESGESMGTALYDPTSRIIARSLSSRSIEIDRNWLVNRLEHAVNTIINQEYNQQAAESVIRDTDYAIETAKFSRDNIVLQAATAMLAQGNMIPGAVLSLVGR